MEEEKVNEEQAVEEQAVEEQTEIQEEQIVELRPFQVLKRNLEEGGKRVEEILYSDGEYYSL